MAQGRCRLDTRFCSCIPHIEMDAFFLFFWYSLTWLLMLTKHRDSLCKERILHALVVVWEWNIKYFGVMYNGAVCRNQYWMNDFSFLSGWLVVSSLKKWDEDQYERWRSPKSSFEVKKTLLLSLQYVSKSYVYRSYFNVIASIKNWLRIGKNVFRISNHFLMKSKHFVTKSYNLWRKSFHLLCEPFDF